jgi:alkanesulfonate monooxygenase SsuD/methylene tetrahydromethanopterin reductase-like flavin-dependent oxidoreductase (luciferase family)
MRAIDVLRLLWSAEPSVSYAGKHYTLNDARPGPRPAHPISMFKPRMIRLVGRKADGWLPSLGVLTREALRAGNEQIDEAADNAGRDPRAIRRLINVQGLIGEKEPPSRSQLPVGYLAGVPLAGAPGWWVETIAGFAQDGFRHDRVLAGRPLAAPGRVVDRRGTATAPKPRRCSR